MSFQSIGALLGDSYKAKSVDLLDHPSLPSGRYFFIELYCTDKKCDCRKTIIHVYHEKEHVSSVNYGWEKPSFYSKWMKSNDDDDMAKEMSGLTIDFMSPSKINEEAILEVIETLLSPDSGDKSWVSSMKNHYRHTRRSKIIKFTKTPSLNAPCPLR